MKTILSVALSTAVIFFSCKKDKEADIVLPTVTTIPVSVTTSSEAMAGGEISNQGSAAVTARGVVWGTTANPTIDLTSKTSDGAGIGFFTSSITGLQPNTAYHVRAYATSSAGTAYGNDISFTTDAPVPKVYACGYDRSTGDDHASLWADGTGSFLASSSLKSYASSIAVSDAGDVYVVGWDFTGGIDNAKIWKNGVATVLSNSNSRANSVVISGSDVYVAGFIDNGSNYVATYWKNGTAIGLTDGIRTATASSIFVSGSDVYVAGYENSGSVDVACYWKNGAKVVLPNVTSGGKYSRANSIFVSGGDDVYVAGYQFNGTIEIAKYWKNGASIDLGTYSSRANSIFVSGGDVYVAGYEKGAAKYWKNGVETSFTATASYSAEAKSIFVSGSDVYVAVTEYGFPSGEKAKYFKNGVETILSTGDRSGAFGIVVK
ncbi:hypothetical protein [Niabella beijingensis]|uniref:hypothetical protein n=1 Tax=Niabella beijingensis TaxID=2872700 RepID=UPI001CC13B20|nr:hypothetical protein [Niabella beijingensis]MBZ4191584.1 hypothetical protein [Niabella beijingensis]